MKSFYEMLKIVQDAKNEGYLKGALMGAGIGLAGVAPILGYQQWQKTHQPKPYQLSQHFHHVSVPTTHPTTQPDSQKPVIQHVQPIPTSQPAAHPLARVSPETKYIADYVAKNENRRHKVYGDSIGKPTIGIGHLMGPEDDVIFHKLFGNSVDLKKIRAGTATLNDEQIDLLFKYDMDKHMSRVHAKLPNYDTYPTYLKAALLDSVYRGDMKSKVAHSINLNKWFEAAKEYLMHPQYIHRVELNMRGIGPRMERNRDAMVKFGKELGNG